MLFHLYLELMDVLVHFLVSSINTMDINRFVKEKYPYKIIQLRNNIRIECGNFHGIYYGILSIAQNNVMNINKFMK